MKAYLGEFEEVVLSMVAIMGEEAYGNTIVSKIDSLLDRKVNLSAVHITLYRLEDKGYVQSEMRGATASRGGRRKRYFKITSSGMALLQEIKLQKQKLWKLIPSLSFNTFQ